MAPEYLLQGIISTKADIYSLGVIMIKLITGSSEYPYLQLDSPQSTATSCQRFTEDVR
jgi:serine/threonine protein kinase